MSVDKAQIQDQIPSEQEKEPLLLTVHGRTYDLTNWGTTHPGGPVLYLYHNRDCTHVFDAFHDPSTIDFLKRFPSKPSELDGPKQDSKTVKEFNENKTVNPRQILDDFATLRQDLVKEGYFEPNYAWMLYKSITTIGLWPLAWVLNIMGYYWFGMIALAMCWQQCGWLSHDFNHHAVLKNRWWNRFFGWFTGPVILGFSVWWWNDRHNAHHAVTNIQDQDPDIDNLPFLAWSREDVTRASSSQRKLLQYQHLYFWFILPFLNIIWGINSILFVKDVESSSKHKIYKDFYVKEAVGLAMHYCILLAFFISSVPLAMWPVYWFVTKMIAGAGLAFVVFFNHYSCPKFPFESDAGENFVIMQLITTRNLIPGVFTDWFCGGLNYQVEHHLFPTMPRHNFNKTSFRVQKFAKDHNLPYLSSNFIEGTMAIRDFLQSHAAYATELVQREAQEMNKATKVE